MEIKKISLGQKIKRYRLVNDIRQEDMAEKMGVSRATLINYEKGYTTINIDVLNRLKNYYPDFESDEKDSNKPKIVVDNSIDFKVLLRVLLNEKLYILLVTIIFTFFGTASSFLFKYQLTKNLNIFI